MGFDDIIEAYNKATKVRKEKKKEEEKEGE